MGERRHTPGPWRVGPVDDTRVEDALGNEVAQIDGDYNQPETWPVMEANARLIAAAPELLAALEECHSVFAMMIAPDAIQQTTVLHAFAQATDAESKARAAILKATGAA